MTDTELDGFHPTTATAAALSVLAAAAEHWDLAADADDAAALLEDGHLQVELLQRVGPGPAVATLAQIGGLLLAELAEARGSSVPAQLEHYRRALGATDRPRPVRDASWTPGPQG